MKIVVVNLERAIERKNLMVEHFESLGIDFELHQATDWKGLTSEQQASINYEKINRDGRTYTIGSIAAAISKRQVLMNMVDNGPDVICMLEDDVEVTPDFPSVLSSLKDVQFGIVFLHRGSQDMRRFTPHKRLSTGHELGWLRFSQMGAQGIVITREAAQQLLSVEPTVRPGFDRQLARYWRHGTLTYCLRPPVVVHLGDYAGYKSLVGSSQRISPRVSFRRLRRYRHDLRDGVGKRLAYSRLVIAAHGWRRGLREILNL